SKPSPRFGHTDIYDGNSNRMMVFGGATGFPAPCMNDYYVMKQANAQGGTPTWVSVIPTGTAPGVRTLQVSAYDGNTNTLMIFGGYNCNSAYYGDVWILQNANDVSATPNWIQLQPTGTAPTARESASAIYDPNTNSLIVYGGDAGGEPLGDIWILSNANGTGGTPAWTQLNPSNSGPTPRSGHTATYDSVNNAMTIFGGYDGTNVLGETWVLAGANGQGGSAIWTQLTTGQLRRFHTSNYDPISNTMITFGGTTGVEVQAPSADLYTLGDANNVQ
ncbi:MAG: kelch repeat-containing protein, partial [Candidatus Sulfotelmatobacter sp.]